MEKEEGRGERRKFCFADVPFSHDVPTVVARYDKVNKRSLVIIEMPRKLRRHTIPWYIVNVHKQLFLRPTNVNLVLENGRTGR